MIAPETLQKTEQQLEQEWAVWQQAQAERRAAKGYDKPVSDDEALDILG